MWQKSARALQTAWLLSYRSGRVDSGGATLLSKMREADGDTRLRLAALSAIFGLSAVTASTAYADTATVGRPKAPVPYVLYQYEVCPWCNKVKAVLDWYKVPYRVVEVHPLFKSELSFTSYKKVPVLLTPAGQELHESNDMIEYLVKSRADIAEPAKRRGWFGSRVSHEELSTVDRERHWRSWADEKLAKVLTANLYRSWSDSYRAMDYIMYVPSFSYPVQLMGYLAGGAVMYAIGQRLPKKYGLEGADLKAELIKEVDSFVDAVGEDKFLGGLKPCIGDLHVFGIIRAVSMTDLFKDLMAGSRLLPWWSRMIEEVGESSRVEELQEQS